MKYLRNQWFWIGACLVAAYARGLFLTVMDVDASQYASISMEMLQNGSWLEVMHRGKDYLDKPPLLFWTAAGAFRILGISVWAYKLPSLLAAVAGIYATFRFARLFYGVDTGRLAALMAACSLGILIMCNDVRTDTLLLGASSCAVWLLAEYLSKGRSIYLIGGFMCVGLAMLAKGPIGAVSPAFAVGAHLALRREWRSFLKWQWVAGLLLSAALLTPMCWGLYHQFDLHPEKEVNGRIGVSGLYFYFWEQSFGRITGENVWQNDTSPLYFTHVMLWAFLPWSLLLPGALWRRLSDLVRQGFRIGPKEEGYAIGGFLITFVALSLSRYKLPHYIFIVLPWAAVLTARFVMALYDSGRPFPLIWKAAQWCLWIPLLILTAAVPGYIFPQAGIGIWVPIVALWSCFFYHIRHKNAFRTPFDFVRQNALAASAAFFALNFHFYPHLLPYQSSSTAAVYAREAGIPMEKTAFYRRHGHALDFYAGRIVRQLDTPGDIRAEARRQGGIWLFTDSTGKQNLDAEGVVYEPIASFNHFQPAFLKAAFLSPQTRPATLEQAYWLKILGGQ